MATVSLPSSREGSQVSRIYTNCIVVHRFGKNPNWWADMSLLLTRWLSRAELCSWSMILPTAGSRETGRQLDGDWRSPRCLKSGMTVAIFHCWGNRHVTIERLNMYVSDSDRRDAPSRRWRHDILSLPVALCGESFFRDTMDVFFVTFRKGERGSVQMKWERWAVRSVRLSVDWCSALFSKERCQKVGFFVFCCGRNAIVFQVWHPRLRSRDACDLLCFSPPLMATRGEVREECLLGTEILLFSLRELFVSLVVGFFITLPGVVLLISLCSSKQTVFGPGKFVQTWRHPQFVPRPKCDLLVRDCSVNSGPEEIAPYFPSSIYIRSTLDGFWQGRVKEVLTEPFPVSLLAVGDQESALRKSLPR